MKFTSFDVNVGSAEVTLSGIDTEKVQGTIKIIIPIRGYELEIQIRASSRWDGRKFWNMEWSVSEPTPEPTPEPDYQPDDEPDDEPDDN